jgi:DNA-binding NtrC family response regulator
VSLRTGAGVTNADNGFVCDNFLVAASFLLSRAIGLREPFLTASEEGYGILREAVGLVGSRANVLIEGETGTGKRSLAEVIHRVSVGTRPQIRIDCAVAEEIERAINSVGPHGVDVPDHPRGTILLDRFAELPQSHQEMLSEEIRAKRDHIRYIASSKVPMARLAENGALAPSLLRQFEITLSLPPLNRWRADLAMLAWHFLRNANPLLSLDSSALAMLRRYRFAGNIRELQNLVTRLEIYGRDGRARTIDSARVASHFGSRWFAPDTPPRSAACDKDAARNNRPHLRLVMSAGREGCKQRAQH